MKFFEKNGKYNWVDKNNRFVGFENGQCCCEDAGWEITSFDPMEIGFNGKYLSDGLNVIDGCEAQFDLQEETKSGVLRPLGDTSYDYVVMPVKLRDVAMDEVAA